MLETLAMLASLAAAVPGAEADEPASADYRLEANWLCRPDRDDACAQDMATTVIAPDGELAHLAFVPAANPGIDCFYVYPTVSLDPTPNSDLAAGPEEEAAAASQFARFASVCRPFAPVYRQVTLSALRNLLQGGSGPKPDRELAYRDVRAAWRHYLATDNAGRGVILIGHSQGSGVLKRLIAEEIEGKPAAGRLISAYLIGMNVLVPAGSTVGGDFRSTPLCESADQTGCVVSFVSFRETSPPPDGARFGRANRTGMAVACTNPAVPGSSDRAPLDAYLSNRRRGIAGDPAPIPWAGDKPVTTPFVQVPGLLSGQCVDRDGAQYLAVRTNADPADARTDDVGGDLIAAGRIVPEWGLHLIDVNLAIGDLIDLAERQATAYRRK